VEAQHHAFLTSALNRGQWSDSRPGRFTLRERAPEPTEQEAGWTPETVCMQWQRTNPLIVPARNRTPVVQNVA